MTKSKTSKKIKQPKGLEPDMKGSLKHQVGITNLTPTKKEIDPIEELDEALRICKNNTDEKKVLDATSKDKKDKVIKPLLIAQWEEFEDTGERPTVRSSDGEIMAYITVKNIFAHTSKQYMTLKGRIQKLENQMETLKKNEIIDNKATFKEQTITVTVK